MGDLNPATASPAQIDTVLFPLWERIACADGDLRRFTHKTSWTGRRPVVEPKTPAELAQLCPGDRSAMEQAEARLLAAQTAAAPLEEEYQRRGGWTRVWLVTNEDGHVHRHRSCSTCHPTTQFAVVADLSGLDDDEIIEQVDVRACTVCYPSAPTHPAWARGQREADDAKTTRAAERQTVRAARAAEAAAQAIGHPDGQPLVDQLGWQIKTLRQARTELTDLAEERLGGWGNPNNREARTRLERRVAEAVAAKEAKTVDQVIGEAEQRARRRR